MQCLHMDEESIHCSVIIFRAAKVSNNKYYNCTTVKTDEVMMVDLKYVDISKIGPDNEKNNRTR